MGFGRVVRPNMPANLRMIGDHVPDGSVGTRCVLPTSVILSGSIEEMVRYVLAQPRERHWRYFLASKEQPYLGAEEMMTLARNNGWE